MQDTVEHVASSNGRSGKHAITAGPRGERMPTAGWVYLAGVVVVTASAGLSLVVSRLAAHPRPWAAFVVLAACAAVTQLVAVRTSRDRSYHISTAFLVAGALLLSPELVVLLGALQHLPEWTTRRRVRSRRVFDVCNSTLSGLAAWGAAHVVSDTGWAGGGARLPLAGLTACVVLVGLNRALTAGMLAFAHGRRLLETGVFAPTMLLTELVVAAVGVGAAASWQVNRALIPFALAPLLLITRALHVPQLEEQARVDPKTGLLNSRHFASVLNEELARAERFERPASLLMADLDLLREVNNRHGHLAGDGVLAGVADVFRAKLRHYDVSARFGGEEFAILLPETDSEQALRVAERLRQCVSQRVFEFGDETCPFQVTISMGVATFPADGADANELVHRADLAAYRAKLQGRNRVQGAAASGEPAPAGRTPRLVALPLEEPAGRPPERRRRHVAVAHDRRSTPGPARRSRFLSTLGSYCRMFMLL